eukprot:TRINITY_DN41674_c0_g1_i1.p1 TRINITY_DN41674_c0_g1~~TRINITY_DN41674_c0_g1_i1.p1  ORF type:complete len:482 (-),score=96.84 TRINITY_DN41674_c0_g1_i1:743-2188(-)
MQPLATVPLAQAWLLPWVAQAAAVGAASSPSTGDVTWASAAEHWTARREALVAANPLFGRQILREELPALRRLVLEAWRQLAPAAAAAPKKGSADIPGWSAAYLIQGEEDTTEKEEAIWRRAAVGENGARSASDCYVLTFRSRRRTALYFPNSLLAEGRNVLLAAAAAQEMLRGYTYNYYVLMDADAQAAPSWPTALSLFEGFLRSWEPAVGLLEHDDPLEPVLNDSAPPRSMWAFDHIFMAVHGEAARVLLPYDTSWDETCYWVSQWVLTSLASALYRNHILLLPAARIYNPEHSKYPQANCPEQFGAASRRLRAAAPPAARSCILDLPQYFMVMMPEGVQPTYLLPWGAARQKTIADSSVNYTSADLSKLEPCHDEPTSQALMAPTSYWQLPREAATSWCRECSDAEDADAAQLCDELERLGCLAALGRRRQGAGSALRPGAAVDGGGLPGDRQAPLAVAERGRASEDRRKRSSGSCRA